MFFGGKCDANCDNQTANTKEGKPRPPLYNTHWKKVDIYYASHAICKHKLLQVYRHFPKKIYFMKKKHTKNQYNIKVCYTEHILRHGAHNNIASEKQSVTLHAGNESSIVFVEEITA